MSRRMVEVAVHALREEEGAPLVYSDFSYPSRRSIGQSSPLLFWDSPQIEPGEFLRPKLAPHALTIPLIPGGFIQVYVGAPRQIRSPPGRIYWNCIQIGFTQITIINGVQPLGADVGETDRLNHFVPRRLGHEPGPARRHKMHRSPVEVVQPALPLFPGGDGRPGMPIADSAVPAGLAL